jgi:hypothetical protein
MLLLAVTTISAAPVTDAGTEHKELEHLKKHWCVRPFTVDGQKGYNITCLQGSVTWYEEPDGRQVRVEMPLAPTDADLAHIDDVPHVFHLDLCGPGITDKTMARVGRMRSLRSLDLQDTKVTDHGVAKLTGLKNLRYLQFYRVPVTDACLVEVRKLPKLENLSFLMTNVHKRAVDALQKERPGLKVQIREEHRERPRSGPKPAGPMASDRPMAGDARPWA